jgi:hypothetical protein
MTTGSCGFLVLDGHIEDESVVFVRIVLVLH